MNKKVKRVALFSALSSKVNANELVVIDSIVTDTYSTKTMVAMLNAVNASKKTLIVLPAVDEKVIKSCDNIAGVKTTVYNSINVYDILNCDKLVLAKGAAEKIQEVYVK
jgi:large subunit ribosomal protein L4